jgi:hypothetical protein
VSTFQEIIETLPEESKTLLKAEIKKFEKFFDTDVQQLSAEQLSALLSTLNSEIQGLSVKLIQSEAQLEEKQKELDSQTEAILQKYSISDISELDGKKVELETELNKQLAMLKETMEKIKE